MKTRYLRKKVGATIICTGIIVSMLAGCGTKENQDSVSETGEEQVVLTIMSSLQTEPEGEIELEYAKEFMKEHSNIKIEFVGVPSNELNKKIISLNSAGDLPDAFTIFPEFIDQAMSSNIVIDHTEVLGEEYIDGLQDNVVEEIIVDDKLAMAPTFVVPSALIYRLDWLEETSIDQILTMDDFFTVAKEFTTDGKWGFSMVGTNNASGHSRFKQFTRAFGIREAYQDENGEWESDLLTDEYSKVLKQWVDLALVDKVVPPGVAEAGYPEASSYFAQEQTGLMITGSNAIGAILGQNPDLKGKIGSCPIPEGKQHVSSLSPTGYGITTACENPEEMAEFIKFITNKEHAVDFALKTGRLPVTEEAAQEEELNTPEFKGFIESIAYAQPDPKTSVILPILDTMAESYNSLLGGSATMEEVMETVESKVKPLLEEANEE